MTEMKQVRINAKEEMESCGAPRPKPGEGQVLVRVAWAGICGSDLHYFFDGQVGAFKLREPLVPGHEIVGIVAEDPSGTYAPGTPVTPHPATFGQPQAAYSDSPHLWPGGAYLGSASTWPHTQGGMSEYILLRLDQIHALPPNLPLKRGVLTEPLCVGLHALHRLQAATGWQDLKGRNVAVIGAGPIGLLAAGAAKSLGATVSCIDVQDAPLRRAQALGVDQVYNSTVTEPEAGTFDAVLECAGAFPAISQAFQICRPRGTVVQVGMVPAIDGPVNLAPLTSKEITYLGTFRFLDEIDQALEILANSPQLESVITHEFNADEAERAFHTAKDSAASGKVIVNLWFEE